MKIICERRSCVYGLYFRLILFFFIPILCYFQLKCVRVTLVKKLILIFVNSTMSSKAQMENNKIIACIIHKTMKCKETHSRYDLHLQKDLSANFSAFTKKSL